MICLIAEWGTVLRFVPWGVRGRPNRWVNCCEKSFSTTSVFDLETARGGHDDLNNSTEYIFEERNCRGDLMPNESVALADLAAKILVTLAEDVWRMAACDSSSATWSSRYLTRLSSIRSWSWRLKLRFTFEEHRQHQDHCILDNPHLLFYSLYKKDIWSRTATWSVWIGPRCFDSRRTFVFLLLHLAQALEDLLDGVACWGPSRPAISWKDGSHIRILPICEYVTKRSNRTSISKVNSRAWANRPQIAVLWGELAVILFWSTPIDVAITTIRRLRVIEKDRQRSSDPDIRDDHLRPSWRST